MLILIIFFLNQFTDYNKEVYQKNNTQKQCGVRGALTMYWCIICWRWSCWIHRNRRWWWCRWCWRWWCRRWWCRRCRPSALERLIKRRSAPSVSRRGEAFDGPRGRRWRPVIRWVGSRSGSDEYGSIGEDAVLGATSKDVAALASFWSENDFHFLEKENY